MKIKKSIRTGSAATGGVNKGLNRKKDYDEEPKKKKKRVAADEVEVRKPKRELAVVEEPVRKKISKLKNPKKMRSIVGESAEEISQLLETGDTDQAVSMMYKRMLQALMDLLPYAEQQVRKTKAAKGVYQVNALISNIRELMVDIQAAQDRGRIAEDLIQRVMQPAFRELATQFIRDYDALDTDLRRVGKVSIELQRPITPGDLSEMKDTILKARERLANSMQEQYKFITAGLIQHLQR